ncbi:MAG TPA: glycosyltransferase family 39 protein [Solirubrobacteraceae bacterium]
MTTDSQVTASLDARSDVGRGPLKEGLRGRGRHVALAPALALSALLNLYGLSQNGYANVFYSAGVKSMLVSLHNFLFVSSDPGGLVTIDKPPLGLWVQAVSAKLFGFSPLSLLLPEAVIGVACVAALYFILAGRFGVAVASVSALALAVFPSLVAVARDNAVDPLLILLMILSCGAALRAIGTGRWRWLLACAVLVGLAFNTKTLAAYLVVPPIALAYLLCAPGAIAARAGRLLAGGLVMLLVSFSWIAAVELTPAPQRPYVGSSTDNSELGLTFSYNGFGRLGGQVGGPGRIPTSPGGLARRSTAHTPREVNQTASRHASEGARREVIHFAGPTGPFRLFGNGLGEQGGWMLPLVLAGLLTLTLAWITRGYRARRASAADWISFRSDPRLAGTIVLGGWFAVEAVALSFSKGIIHPYYASALGPGAAAMIGLGAGAFVERRDWRLVLFALAVAATVAVQLVLMDREHFMHWFRPALLGVGALAVVCVLADRRAMRAGMALALCVLLAAPAAFSASTWDARVYGTFPAAGPRQAAGRGTYGVSAASLDTDRMLERFLSRRRSGSRWALLTVASDTAAPFILTGTNAGALAGYTGTDPVLDGRGLARLVASGQARFVLLGGAYASRGGNAATLAVARACGVVATRDWLGRPSTFSGLVLFDCAGHERALAAS